MSEDLDLETRWHSPDRLRGRDDFLGVARWRSAITFASVCFVVWLILGQLIDWWRG
jgi:hypothetical protein